MARQRPSHQKREREAQKRQRELKKAEKAAERRERRKTGDEPEVVPPLENGEIPRESDDETAVTDG